LQFYIIPEATVCSAWSIGYIYSYY